MLFARKRSCDRRDRSCTNRQAHHEASESMEQLPYSSNCVHYVFVPRVVAQLKNHDYNCGQSRPAIFQEKLILSRRQSYLDRRYSRLFEHRSVQQPRGNFGLVVDRDPYFRVRMIGPAVPPQINGRGDQVGEFDRPARGDERGRGRRFSRP